MVSLREQHSRIRRGFAWLAIAAAATTLAAASAVYLVSTADEASYREVGDYHLHALNNIRAMSDDLQSIDRRRGEGPGSTRPGALVFAMKQRLTALETNQAATGDPEMTGTMQRLANRVDRLGPCLEDQAADWQACVGSVRLALQQLEKLHIRLADVELDEIRASQGDRTRILAATALAILLAMFLLFGLVFAWIARTLADHQRAQDTLDRTQQELQDTEKLRALGLLVGGIAHDFNNLLTIINGYIEVTLQSGTADTRSRAKLNEALAAGERAAKLTRQLLAFSRPQETRHELVDLNAIASDASTMLQPLLGDELDFVIALADAPALVAGDKGQLEQVVTNLVLNARDAVATTEGRIELRTLAVALADGAAGADSQYFGVIVQDNGSGMDEQTQRRAFDPFYTTKGRGEGTGLGLSTVHGIVTSHGGRVEIDTAPGDGTTVRVLLPAATGAVSGATLQGSERPMMSRGNECLLIIEDETPIRSLMESDMSARGYSVLSAGSGNEAIELSAAHPGAIDLIVSDVIMPGMNGPEAVDTILKTQPGAAVIYVSGYTDDVVLESGVGESHVLVYKPFRMSEVANLVRQTLDARTSAA